MYTVNQVKLAFGQLKKADKRCVIVMMREYREAIQKTERNYDDNEIRRYYADQTTVLHGQICDALHLIHRESMRSVLL
jgi:GTP1/Obg family GTP-binding protein